MDHRRRAPFAPTSAWRFELVDSHLPLDYEAANQRYGTTENGSAGMAQTYRIQNWRWVRLRTLDHHPTPILEFGTSEPLPALTSESQVELENEGRIGMDSFPVIAFG
jgi:hypothetical protein